MNQTRYINIRLTRLIKIKERIIALESKAKRYSDKSNKCFFDEQPIKCDYYNTLARITDARINRARKRYDKIRHQIFHAL